MRKLAFVFAALLAVAAPSRAETILVGTPGPAAGQDCIPFGCGFHEQFIYDASYFPEAILIDTLTFFNSVVDSPDSFGGPFTMTLSTTSSTVAAPSTTFATNLGADAQAFGVFNPAGAIPATFSFTGTPFAYNPANGNLLLDITSPNSPFSGFTDYNGGAGFNVSRVWNANAAGEASGAVDTHYGPVTQFEGDTVAVPEPGTLTLLGLGLCSVAAGLRRRKNQSRG
jgi:PEP-CTERM motif-containing protein